jgi:hypothetical protein
MKPRHPIPSLDKRATPYARHAAEARREHAVTLVAITCLALLLILALVLATTPRT